jgi:hypothetical protein
VRAYWDLSRKPCTFDFVVWLSIVKTMGATEIVFDVSKGIKHKKFGNPVFARMMYENVLQPACGLFDLPWSQGTEGDFTPGYLWGDALATWREHGKLAMPSSGLPRLNGIGHCITIRQSVRNQYRDSNRAAWMRFAEETGATVIEDAFRKPIALERRMQLYESAQMNWIGSNGPAVLLILSRCPYRFFSPPVADPTWQSTPEIRPGVFQFPWATPDQRTFWADDTYENIIAASA